MKKIMYKIARVLLRFLLPIINFPAKRISVEEARENIKKICKERELFLEDDIVNQEIDEKIDLSIVIPVYNVEKYLQKCLESVVNQNTKYQFEVIIVNDGSTDHSLNILEQFEKQYHFIKIIHQENQGLSGARNTGINYATGRFITFIDSDDFIEKDYIEKMMNAAIQNDADMVMCSIQEYDVLHEKIVKLITHEKMSVKEGIKDEILNLKGYAWGKIYKRKLWEKVRFPVGFLFEDAIIRTIIMRLCKSFEFIDEPLYSYTIRPDSLSRKSKEKRKSEKYLEQYFMQEKILQLSEKMNLTKDNVLYKILLYELGVCLWLRTRYFEEKIKKDIFALSCHLIENYRIESNELNFEYRYLEKAFVKKNYILWKLVSIYVMLGVKGGKR